MQKGEKSEMAVYSRSSTDQLLMPGKWSNERFDQPDRRSPERTIIWSQQPTYSSVIKGSVPVVYYLSRNGQLDHPHFIQVPLSSSHGLFLKDVMNKLNFVRGNGMAYMYSWSTKRSYKNGYVWQDLAEDDQIQPTPDHDYILKGSEILQPTNTFRSLPEITAVEAYNSSPRRSGKPRKKNQSWSENPTNNPSESNSIHECRLVRKCESSREFGGARASADMATQTEAVAVDVRRSKSMREEKVYVNKCVESSREELSNLSLSPPSMSSSDGLDGGSRSGDVDRCAGVTNLPVQNERTSGSRIKPSRVLMQLISCGSTAKDLGSIKNGTRGYSVRARCGRTVLRDVVDG